MSSPRSRVLGATLGGGVFTNSSSEVGTPQADTTGGIALALRAGILGRRLGLHAEASLLVGPTTMLGFAPLLEVRVTDRLSLRAGPAFGHAERTGGSSDGIRAEGGFGGVGAVGADLKRWGRHVVGLELRISAFAGNVLFGALALGATWRY